MSLRLRMLAPLLAVLLMAGLVSTQPTGSWRRLLRAGGVDSTARASRSCRALTPNDGAVERALGAPVKRVSALASDRQTCEFESAEHKRLDVSVRPGVGRVTIDSWLNGRMPLNAMRLSGVGERAVWQPELNEVLAEQNDLLCDATLVRSTGAERPGARATEELDERLGAICNEVFATVR